MIERQKYLDSKFNVKGFIKIKRDKYRNLIAMMTELGEVSQSAKKFWCYWKVKCEFNKLDFLEELSDYLHFLLTHIYTTIEIKDEDLSLFNSQINKELENFTEIRRKEQTFDNALLYLNLPITYELAGFDIDIKDIYTLFIAITALIVDSGSNWKEFLEIHHNKFLKNLNERIKESY